MGATRRAVYGGLLAGGLVLYLSLVGMIEKFNGIRLVENVLTLGRLLILLPMFLGGILLSRPRIVDGKSEHPGLARSAVGGLEAGAVGGAVVGAFVLIVNAIGVDTVREVFVAVTEGLMEMLTFGRGIVPGVILLLVLGTASGALGGALGAAPVAVRRPIVIGLSAVLIMAMLQDVIRVVLVQLGIKTGWLYSIRWGGLTYLGVVVVFVAAAGTIWAWHRPSLAALQTRISAQEDTARQVRIALIALSLLILAILPQLLGTYLSAILGRVGIFILMGLGLNIVVGNAGLLNLGNVAFYAVGAYGTALLTASAGSGSNIHLGLPFLIALPFVMTAAVLVGLLIAGPVLHLRGDYLAIVTLAFGEIARVLITSDLLKPILGGAQGLIDIPAPTLTVGALDISFRDPQPFYYLALAFCALAILVSVRVSNSRVGRAWVAMREDEQVAEATGVSTVRYKLLAFGVGAAIGSISGALFAVQIGSLSPTSFSLLVSIQALAIVILGGLGSIRGVVLGAVVLIGLPGLLSEFEEFQLLIYGAVLVGIMLLRPQGLLPNTRRARELADEERAQDQWARRHPGEAQDEVAAEAAAREVP